MHIVSSQTVGRHRSPARYNPVTELRGILREAASPMTRTAMALAATGGLVASVAAPASAKSASDRALTPVVAAAATTPELPVVDLPTDIQAPVTERGAGLPAAVDSPLSAVGAPAEVAALASDDAKVKVEDVAKKAADAKAKEKAKADREAVAQVSRTAERTAIAAPAQGDDAPAAEPAAVQYGGGLLGDTYPGYRGAIDPFGFWPGECVSFVAHRLNTVNGIAFNSRYAGRAFNGAGTWGGAAKSAGITVNGTPARGAVAWNSRHVAWVASVNPGGTVTIEEYNWGGDHRYHVRTMPVGAFQYIHFADL